MRLTLAGKKVFSRKATATPECLDGNRDPGRHGKRWTLNFLAFVV